MYGDAALLGGLLDRADPAVLDDLVAQTRLDDGSGRRAVGHSSRRTSE
jgi:hypothetical protein